MHTKCPVLKPKRHTRSQELTEQWGIIGSSLALTQPAPPSSACSRRFVKKSRDVRLVSWVALLKGKNVLHGAFLLNPSSCRHEILSTISKLPCTFKIILSASQSGKWQPYIIFYWCSKQNFMQMHSCVHCTETKYCTRSFCWWYRTILTESWNWWH
jgi:hypothetical protein